MTPAKSNQSLSTTFNYHVGDERPSKSLQIAMGLGRPFPQLIPDAEAFVVDFDGQGDPLKPYNWTTWTKYVLAINLS